MFSLFQYTYVKKQQPKNIIHIDVNAVAKFSTVNKHYAHGENWWVSVNNIILFKEYSLELVYIKSVLR